MSFRTHNLSLSHSVFMKYCFPCSFSCFSSSSYFISYSCFMNTTIHIAFPIFSCYYYIWNFIYLYSMMLMYSLIIHVFLSLNESILLRNWNHSNWIIQTKVMAFSCQTSQFTDFGGLNSIPDTVYLYSFKAKVLRVLLQLESPKSDNRNSSYVLNNPYYSMIKTEAKICLNIAPL